MREETFGPAIGIMRVEDDIVQIETSTWFKNRCDYLDPALAWTGAKDPGRGCTLSRLGLDMFETLLKPYLDGIEL